MAQYDVHINPSLETAQSFPYLLEVQSDLFEDATRVVIVPMVPSENLRFRDDTLNPEFDIDERRFALFPLDIASVNRIGLGPRVTNLASQSDAIVSALDLLLSSR